MCFGSNSPSSFEVGNGAPIIHLLAEGDPTEPVSLFSVTNVNITPSSDRYQNNVEARVPRPQRKDKSL